MKNLMLSDDASVMDGTICPPPGLVPDDLGHLLSIVAARLDAGGVLALDGQWADLLRDALPDKRRMAADGAVVTVGPAAWSARVLPGDTWIRWVRAADDYDLWTAEIGVMEPRGRSTPLIHRNPLLTATNLHAWTLATSTPWVGTPGMTGNAMLMRAQSGKQQAPRWRSAIEWPAEECEAPYSPRQWHTEPAAAHVHGYDQNKAYLAALACVELAHDDLTHRGGRQDLDTSRGGIWRVRFEPWPHGDLLPDPAGYGPVAADGTRWVTTPTLALVDSLTDDPITPHMGYEILESWTAPARRVTRLWAAQLRDLVQAEHPVLSAAAARVYKESYGMWARPTARIYRPDWHHSVTAMARANLWRKLRKFADAGRYPVRVETDAVYYASECDTWDEAAPPGMNLDTTGRTLGAFKHEPGRVVAA